MTSRTSQDLPTISPSTLLLFHRLSKAAQGLRPFLQPTKHNHSSSKEGAAIVAEWQSQGENIITKHFAYTTMVGDAHPPGEPRTIRSEVNRVAHTLSHLQYADNEVNDWLLTHVSSVHNGTGLNSLMVCLGELEGVRAKALQELQHTNEKHWKAIKTASLYGYQRRKDAPVREVECSLQNIGKTITASCVDALIGYWKASDILGGQLSPRDAEQIKADGIELHRRCGRPERMGTILDHIYSYLPGEGPAAGSLSHSQVGRREPLADCIHIVKYEAIRPLDDFGSRLDSVGRRRDSVSVREVFEDLEELKKYLGVLMQPDSSMESLQSSDTPSAQRVLASLQVGRDTKKLTEDVSTCMRVVETYLRARDKIRSCSGSDYHLPLGFQAWIDEETDESDTSSVD